jgi:ABC-type sugar transport system ATPase subunit
VASSSNSRSHEPCSAVPASFCWTSLLSDCVYEILAKLKGEGMTLLIVEQSLNRARAFADHICVMRDGLIQARGSGHSETDVARLTDAYFGFDMPDGGAAAAGG